MKKSHADNVTMSEGGLYSLATKGAKDVIDIATPKVLNAIEQIELKDRFSLSDSGCADAGTSLDMIRKSIKKAQSINPDIQTIIIYSDQPANDFNALMSIVHGKTQFETWLGQFSNAYPLASGSSFYLQCVPDQTLHLVFSATAMHWLSRKPCNISNHVHMIGAEGTELKSFKDQAKKDWETILVCRAKELKPGGKLVLVNFCRDEQGRYLGHTGGINMFDTFNEIWLEFLSENRISEQEYKNMTLPQYYRDVEEFSAPLTDENNDVYRSGLRLDSIETRVVTCPFAAQFKIDGDVKAFADGLIPTIRSWNQSIYFAALETSRAQIERSAIINDYYQSYHDRVMNNPKGHGMDYVHAYMTISKV